MKTPPDTIWLDARVASTMKTEPDQSREFAGQACYKRIDVFNEMVRKLQEQAAQFSGEVVVQIALKNAPGNDGAQYSQALVLTSLGRMFEEISPGKWSPYQGPSLEPRT